MRKEVKEERPVFPKRAVVTGGMPYGNKELHFGHVGGMFIHADTFARFLKDRIGKDNVLFVSGTDCYGSPIVVDYQKKNTDNQYPTLTDFVRHNHEKQKEILAAYLIEPTFFGASGLPPADGIHLKVCNEIFHGLYKKGVLKKIQSPQFFDEEAGAFLNGRQVIGKCPVEGCQSEKGYADECDLGHQYDPSQLIDPISILSGKTPVMKEVVNWYFAMEDFREELSAWVAELKARGNIRPYVISSIEEFLHPPVVHIKRKFLSAYEAIREELYAHTLEDDGKKPSFVLRYASIALRDKACVVLKEKNIPFRTGKTLTPFRLTGNIPWGVKADALEGLEGLTFWVWPESLWAPISFCRTWLEEVAGADPDEWKNWWMSKDAQVYQFIGEDNLYFYGPAEMSMFLALEPDMPLPVLVANRHVLFMNKKASSSGSFKPPMAEELLQHYTAEQLRAHFLSLGLGNKSVGIQPKVYNPDASEKEPDPVLKEGKLLSNVFNRLARSCFYTAQKYNNAQIPRLPVSPEIETLCRDAILQYEKDMYHFAFHTVMYLLDTFIRDANKYWVKNMKEAEDADDMARRMQVLADAFHLLKCGMILLHPIAPKGTALLQEYLQVTDAIWCWDGIFEPIHRFCAGGENHSLKEIPPRFDFF